jgi:hypothetical protein
MQAAAGFHDWTQDARKVAAWSLVCGSTRRRPPASGRLSRGSWIPATMRGQGECRLRGFARASREQRRSTVAAKKKKQRESIGGNPPARPPKPKKQKKTSRGK